MPQVSCSYITATPPGSTTVAPATIVNIAARVVNGDFPSTGAQPISHIFRMYVNGVKIAEKTVRGPNGLAGETEIADFLGASVLVVAHMVISVKVVGTSVETDLRVLVLDYNIQQAAIIPPTTFPPDGAKSSNTPWIIGGVIAGMVALAAILKKK